MLGWRLEKGSAPLWLRALIPVVSIAVTFLLTTTLLVLARANPFAAFYAMLIEPLSAPVSALEVLVKATPLLLTGLAVVFAFQSGYYNIGAEGQLYAGALAAAWIGQLPLAHAWPGPVVIALMLVGGFVAGMLWAFVPALLRTRLGVDEVVTTLLLNTVMLYLVNAILNAYWLDPVTNWPQSPRVAVHGRERRAHGARRRAGERGHRRVGRGGRGGGHPSPLARRHLPRLRLFRDRGRDAGCAQPVRSRGRRALHRARRGRRAVGQPPGGDPLVPRRRGAGDAPARDAGDAAADALPVE